MTAQLPDELWRMILKRKTRAALDAELLRIKPYTWGLGLAFVSGRHCFIVINEHRIHRWDDGHSWRYD